jgi:hypothetical protein
VPTDAAMKALVDIFITRIHQLHPGGIHKDELTILNHKLPRDQIHESSEKTTREGERWSKLNKTIKLLCSIDGQQFNEGCL